MKEFNFTIKIDKNEDNSPMVFIDAFAPEWDEIVREEKFIGIFKDIVIGHLHGAYCLRGKLFNLSRHSPRQLYEALLDNPDYEVIVDGEIPEDDDDGLPPGAVD